MDTLYLSGEERAGFRLRELYRRYGYTHYRMSKFEEYDLYLRNKHFLVSENILTFTDTDGKLMALKPDVTLSIVKNIQSGGALEKVFYNENVYRTSPAAQGYREIMQAGLECIGELDLCAVAEVVLLAAKSLETVGDQFLLDLSHMGFVDGLLAALELEETGRRRLLAALGERNAAAIRSAAGELGLAEERGEQLCRLALLYGPPEEVLPELESMAESAAMAEALQELKAVCCLMGPYQDRLRLDFSMVSDMRYYSGLMLRGYLPGIPGAVLSGGRYDNLLRRMGKEGGALGFAVYLDLLERLDPEETRYDADVLLLYGEAVPACRAAEEAETLRRQGLSVRLERQAPWGLRFRETREVR